MINRRMNVLANTANRFQGPHKRVLCVCSAGLLRSPTTAVVLSQPPYNYNTRACGLTEDFALIPFDQALACWAQEIVCMEASQKAEIESQLAEWDYVKPVIVLNIQDNFAYRDPKLMEAITTAYNQYLETLKGDENHGT